MNSGRSVFSQIMDFLPLYEFNKCVRRYQGNRKVRSFTCLDQFYTMAFAQLTYRESLRDIEACLKAMQSRLYHLGFRSTVSRSTLADANDSRDWRIFADFAQVLISRTRPLYAEEDIGISLDNVIYALDSTTIDLCLTLFPWAKFRRRKAAVKMHTLLDIHGPIPVFAWISEGNVHDVNVLDLLVPEPGAIYLMDRAYIDFGRLHTLAQGNAFFVTRAKSNIQYSRVRSHPVIPCTGIRSDQTIRLTGVASRTEYPELLRRVHYFDQEHGRHLYFLTNHFSCPATTVADLYRCRWRIELFFKWIKQHLRIKAFYGLSENAVKTQIWIAICVYVLLAMIKKKMKVERTLYTILQVASVSLFEKLPLEEAFSENCALKMTKNDAIQLNLFEL